MPPQAKLGIQTNIGATAPKYAQSVYDNPQATMHIPLRPTRGYQSYLSGITEVSEPLSAAQETPSLLTPLPNVTGAQRIQNNVKDLLKPGGTKAVGPGSAPFMVAQAIHDEIVKSTHFDGVKRQRRRYG